MKHFALLLLLPTAIVTLNCGGDSVNEPEAPATRRVTLHFAGVATSHGQPMEGVVVEYKVYPCPYSLHECDRRTVTDTTDELGRYSIYSERTCVLHQDLSTWPADTVRGDFLSAYLPLSAMEHCLSPGRYGRRMFLCTSLRQEFDFDFSHCP